VSISAALVMLMTPGLALFYGGMVRTKNVLGTIMQSFMIIALISVQWILFGYRLVFGPDVGGLIGDLSWFGWFGFNAGSAVAAGMLSTSAFVVTHIAGAGGALSWAVVEWIYKGKPTTLGAVSGAVAGLATITPASGFVTPMPALLLQIFLKGGAIIFGWYRYCLE